MITLVTTTRDRPLAFSLLEKWIARQTVRFDEWIVVNDGNEAYTYTAGQTVMKRNPEGDTLPSICENWLAAIPFIHGDKVVVAEDDDWLHPEFVATLVELLDRADLAGVRDDFYWKLRSRKFLRMRNQHHASLGASAFRASVLPQIERCCKVFKKVFIDMYLWAEATSDDSGLVCALHPNEASDGRALHVGIKQVPGAAGLGLGHADDGSSDPEFRILKKWIGADVEAYRAIQ